MIKLGMMKEQSQKDHILIIEDSVATAILLKNYLSSMGYEDIHTCQDGKTGTDTFKDLVKAGTDPIVLLDFVLPDMDAKSIMTQLLEVKPDVKVILSTATEKTDQGVTELIRRGLYQYMEKPIRFEKLKQILDTLNEERKYFEKDSKLKVSVDADKDLYKEIDFVLKSQKQISLTMIQQLVGGDEIKIESYIKDLESKNKLTKLENKREMSCNQCDSVKVIQIFYCPSCQRNDFKQVKIIEHFACGNFSVESEYVNDKCPKCKKDIKTLGVDYRVLKNRYLCNKCSEIFQELSSSFLCLKCENKFSVEEVRWKTSQFFKITDM